MNIHVIGVILLNDTQIIHISFFHPHFRETDFERIFDKIHDEKCRFFVQYNKSYT